MAPVARRWKHCMHYTGTRPPPPDSELEAVLRAVRLEGLLEREAGGQTGLDCRADWASILSLGEQQRLAFTR